MRLVEFTPECLKAESAILEGSIMLSAPSYMQRCNYIADANFDHGQKDNGIDGLMKNMKAIAKMVELSKDHYKEVKLKYKADGVEIKSFEEMIENPDCDPVLQEVALAIMNGLKPSPKSMPL